MKSKVLLTPVPLPRRCFGLRRYSKVIFGAGKFDLLPEEVSFLLTGGNVLVIMDPAIKPQIWPRVEKLLAAWKTIPCEIKPGEPTVQTLDEMADFARKEKPNLVVGIGGGSAMDTAKAIAGLMTNPGSSEKYRGQNLLTRPAIPGIMVPTTAGTGSELTQTAVLIHQGRKGGINSPHIIPSAAILDPFLLLGLPTEPTRATGLDALTHAIESFLSKNSNPLTEPISLQAAALLAAGLPAAVTNGQDPEARTKTMMGSLLGGISLANAGVIVGLPESPITSIILRNVQITAEKNFEIKDAGQLTFDNVTLTVRPGLAPARPRED